MTFMNINLHVNKLRLHWIVPILTAALWLWTVRAADPELKHLAPTIMQWFIGDFFSACTLILFPLTILSLALIERRRGLLGRRVAFLGEISYSSYLLHFPLQLTIALTMAAWHVDQGIAYSRLFMLLFFAILIPLSFATHRFFELPVQRWLRHRYAPSAGLAP